MTAMDDATKRQVQAARPDASTWLAANAGSGKTRVLTDRVARLLLAGVEPQHILCLTYTKAAASEMQNRLFKRLGEWAMLPDDGLRTALAAMGAEHDLVGDLSQARTLFARALETPGGLKIQTIHSFCSSLLRRFPLEARVSPQFTEMEDRAAALLQAAIVEDFADGPQAHLVDGLARYMTDSGFESLTAAIVRHREAFAGEPDRAALWRAFGLPADADETIAVKVAFDGTEPALMARAIPVLRQQSPTMVNLADALAAIDWHRPDQVALEVLYGAFLYAGRAEAKKASVPTSKAQAALGPHLVALHDLMDRVAAARQSELALHAARKALALHRFAALFLPEYERRKQQRGWLDFDDLIAKARRLLNDPAVAAWVLYRLDGGIDHILIDEAQDTSPAQWDVVEKLAQEFTSGLGARSDHERTIFVVGDKKQSIYSFQGADPRAFDRMRAEFERRLAGAGKGLQGLELSHSFRSAPVILRLVDLVFEGKVSAGFDDTGKHIAFKSDLPGRVDLWPVVEMAPDGEDRHWTDPVDRPGARHHDTVLAERIADAIRSMIDSGETIPDDADGTLHRRKVRPGDFLILVRRRSDLFSEIIRACKVAGLPIAGADRLKVGAELAVRDLGALLSFLATPEDSLSLAAALKSPLFGWTEQQLFDLAHRRDGPFLWPALRDRLDEFPAEMAVLTDLRDHADFLRPYDLIERILTRHGGRKRLIARLGEEAEDGIDALLGQALAYERSEIPSLTGFLVWMETDDLEIKRQVGTGGDLVRVMTVHGAKGLESPIVILPDTGPRRAPRGGEIVDVDGMPLWKMGKQQMPPVMADAQSAAADREEEERLRLLYVALTRAEKWLIVAAAGDLGSSENSWYRMIQAVVDAENAARVSCFGQDVQRLEDGDWHGLPQKQDEPAASVAVTLPDYFAVRCPAAPADRPVLNPSDLGGAKALPGESGLDEDAAMLRGTRIHLLLEHLPAVVPARRQAVADHLLRDVAPEDRRDLIDEALGVLNAPDLAPVFGPDSLAEVGITAELGAARLHGTIDRLLVGPDRVLAVDFKTNAAVPDSAAACPEGLLRQMGAYARALAQVYPGKTVETAILWTRTATLMALPPEIVSRALERAAPLDATPAQT